ncbi:MAG: MnmC family methyltransferase [Mariprofundaceae bacterium]|nr:MnmC family methyltransferase [Mariprofundaceae bacterium]
MTDYTLLDTCNEHGTIMRLFQRQNEFAIRVDHQDGELMHSSVHNSEDILAKIACKHITDRENPHLLVGGLGMGFTLAAALAHSSQTASITVAELMPAVVRWNQGALGAVAGHPLKDKRVNVLIQDVGKVMREHKNGFDAIMLDVDNGPDGFTRDNNDNLYGLDGLEIAYEALRPNGILTVWSADTDQAFTQRLMKLGFEVEERRVREDTNERGAIHTIWIAIRY